MNTTPILRATNIVKKLGGKTILNDVSLDVHKGDVKVVIGPSGAGKSTFLQCLNYLLPPDSGDIWLEGKKVNARDTRELCALRQQVGMIFQDFNLFDHLTAEENVSIALRKVMGCNKAEARNRALTELSRVGLAKRAALYPAQLSGGQKQRVAIARALITKPSLVFADEPTGNLDSVSSAEVLSFLKRSVKELGQTVIMVTHDAVAASYADRAIVFADGQIVADEQRPTAESMNQLLMNERERATQLVGGPSAGTTVPRPPVAALKGHTEKASFVPGAPSVPGAPQHAAVAQHRR